MTMFGDGILRELGARLRVAAICGLALAMPAASLATPAKEAPWLPEAAAYRLTLFLGNLSPVPWAKLEAAWATPYRGAEISTPGYDALANPARAGAIRAAIATQDRQALFEAATSAVATELLGALEDASAALGQPEAQAALREAQELYRSFSDGVTAADPEAARAIGLAWLDLVSSAGSTGVLGTGAVEANEDRFAAARAVVETYMLANYMPDRFATRDALTPIPESAFLDGRAVELPPTLPPGTNIADQVPLPKLVLKFEEQGIDETDLPLIAYGDMLFDSPEIFGGPARALNLSCATCHNRSDINRDFFIPGASHQPGAVDVDGAFFNPIFNDRRDDPLDIPSMRGIRFTGPYGRDGRFASLREFTRNVIVGEFAGAEPTPFMLDALVAYMIEFEFLPNAKLTPQGELTGLASEATRRGEALFNRPFDGLGGKSCATCHLPSSNFLDRQAHDIGSAAPAYEGARGGAFDTPTLLGARFTAPYFHDGSLPTLGSVVDWFDSTKSLGLSDNEKADLTAYLEAVGDADEPYEAFDARNTPFRLAFEELTTFASTLDTLLPRRDAFHIGLLIDTVASDLTADASIMGNLDAKPEIYRLAETLRAVGGAVEAGDWQEAAVFWEEFKARQAEIDARVY